MTDTLLYELGQRAMRDLMQENTNRPQWRVMAIVLRWYDQYDPKHKGVR